MEVQYAAPFTPSLTAPAVSTQGIDGATLQRHAIEFESMLLTKVMESLEHSYACVPGGQSSDAAHDTEASLTTQALATGIARAGGFGLAKMIVKSLSKSEAADSQAGSVAGKSSDARP